LGCGIAPAQLCRNPEGGCRSHDVATAKPGSSEQARRVRRQRITFYNTFCQMQGLFGPASLGQLPRNDKSRFLLREARYKTSKLWSRSGGSIERDGTG
jgi:hypothetical protein